MAGAHFKEEILEELEMDGLKTDRASPILKCLLRLSILIAQTKDWPLVMGLDPVWLINTHTASSFHTACLFLK